MEPHTAPFFSVTVPQRRPALTTPGPVRTLTVRAGIHHRSQQPQILQSPGFVRSGTVARDPLGFRGSPLQPASQPDAGLDRGMPVGIFC